ncbi:MAG: hypothetical protein IKJ01_06280 [Lachnospiraceae bacterium]|nr:hypothetical protein [Lachnospiraceae bacterium]
MGCTYDVINVTVKNEEDAKIFVETFNEIMPEYLYDEEIELSFEDIREECGFFNIGIGQEPLFRRYEQGEQVTELLLEFLKRAPEADCFAEHYCTFNNCGDALFLEYQYKDKVLHIREVYAESNALDYCEECDEEFYDEPLCTIDDFEVGKIYKCPNCGAELTFEAWVQRYEAKLVDLEWKWESCNE